MRRILRHLVIPAAVTAVFFAVAAMPVEVLGCRSRGLLAFGIALSGGLAALGAVARAVVQRARGDSHSAWWVASGLVLSIPAIYIVIIAQ